MKANSFSSVGLKTELANSQKSVRSIKLNFGLIVSF